MSNHRSGRVYRSSPNGSQGNNNRGVQHNNRPNKRRNMPIIFVVLLDIVGIAVAFELFWLAHTVLPRSLGATPIPLPTPTKSIVVSVSPNPGVTASTQPTDGITNQPTAVADQGMWGAKFPDKFTNGEVVKTDNSYKSKNVNVTMQMVSTTIDNHKITYYVADIYLRNIDNFKTAFADDKAERGHSETTLAMASRNKAVVAVSGDYFGDRENSLLIRNGTLYRETLYKDVLVMYHDGTMATYTKEQVNLDEIKAQGAWQSWSFGPMLLQDGKPMTKFNSELLRANPRCAIGYYEPGHYCFILVDGRQEGYSEGMTLVQMSQMFADMGCKAAYNLDGGQSAVMVFQDGVTNKPYNGGRSISDIVYIADQDQQ